MLGALFAAALRCACAALCVLLPCRRALRAVSAEGPDAPRERRAALALFVALGPLMALEMLPLVTSMLPAYFELKLALLVWLSLPHSGGAEGLFERVLDPVLRRYEGDIDASLAMAKSAASTAAKELGRRGVERIRKHSAQILVKGHALLLAADSNAPERAPTLELQLDDESQPRPSRPSTRE